MKNILIALLMLLPFTASAGQLTSDFGGKDVQRLADQPIATVEDGMCLIKGAVAITRTGQSALTGTRINKFSKFRTTSQGGLVNAPILLVNMETGEQFHALTDTTGFYQVSVPYTGRAVYQERSTSRGSGWSQPTVLCQDARVFLGTIETVNP